MFPLNKDTPNSGGMIPRIRAHPWFSQANEQVLTMAHLLFVGLKKNRKEVTCFRGSSMTGKQKHVFEKKAGMSKLVTMAHHVERHFSLQCTQWSLQ